MKLLPAEAYAAYSYQHTSLYGKPDRATSRANTSASGENIADSVALSQTARNYFANQTGSATASGSGATAVFDTDKGAITLNINDYFSPSGSADGATSLRDSLPPMLLPTKNNIDALTNHISEAFPEFLSQNGIPSAPSNITYDSEGQIVLPSDYEYASELEQALANDPTMSNMLRSVSALASHYAGMQKSVPFLQEYAAATTQPEIDAVIARYGYLFSDNNYHNRIILRFSESGHLNLTNGNAPLS